MNGFNILLVASNSCYCQEAREFLARDNYRLTIIEDYKIASGDFDAIICSINALNNGFELLQLLQENRQIF